MSVSFLNNDQGIGKLLFIETMFTINSYQIKGINIYTMFF